MSALGQWWKEWWEDPSLSVPEQKKDSGCMSKLDLKKEGMLTIVGALYSALTETKQYMTLLLLLVMAQRWQLTTQLKYFITE